MRLLCQIVSVSYDIWSGGVRYFGGRALDCLFGKPEEFQFTQSTDSEALYDAEATDGEREAFMSALVDSGF